MADGNLLLGSEKFIHTSAYVRQWGLRTAADGDIELVRYNASGAEQESVFTIEWDTGVVTFTAANLDVPDESIDSEHYVDGSIDPEHLANPVRTVAADTATIAVANTDHLILFSTTGAGSNTIDFTAMDDGQVVYLVMTAQSTGTYTGTVDGGTLTFNAADEAAVVINDGTAIRVMSLQGATVV